MREKEHLSSAPATTLLPWDIGQNVPFVLKFLGSQPEETESFRRLYSDKGLRLKNFRHERPNFYANTRSNARIIINNKCNAKSCL